MKAAIVEEPGILKIREVPEPVPDEYDALCELLYGATCTGTDTHVIRGRFPFPIAYPAILGHESVGRVVRIGRKVRNFRVGDLITRVTTPPPGDGSVSVAWGGFAEYGLAKDHWAMHAAGLPDTAWAASRVNQILPASVDARVAPMFTTWGETRSYIRRMGIGRGSRLLVIGSGGNGLSFAAHGVNLGVSCVWIVGSPRWSSRAARLGVNGLIDYSAADCVEQLRQACPEGFSTIIDAVGKTGQADRFLPLLEPGGKIGIYGMDDYTSVTITPRIARGSFTIWNGGYDESEAHQEVCELYLQGRLDAGIWYDRDHPWPLVEIEHAFRDLWERREVKILIELKT